MLEPMDVLSLLLMSNNGSQHTSVGGFINDGSGYTLRVVSFNHGSRRASVRVPLL